MKYETGQEGYSIPISQHSVFQCAHTISTIKELNVPEQKMPAVF